MYSPTAITTHLPCSIEDPLSFLENSSPTSLEASPMIPSRKGTLSSGAITPLNVSNKKKSRPSLHLEKGEIADMGFERPYYGLIVDGVHCHPNSVRVCILSRLYFDIQNHLTASSISWHIPPTLTDVFSLRMVNFLSSHT